MISKQTIDEILSVAKIEEVVGEFVQLKRRGQNWVGLCPFHNDRTPSMYVSPRLGIYKCFVCDAGGDSVRFLMEHEKMSYPEALRHIAAKYGIPIVEDEKQTPEETAEQRERDAMFALNEYAANYFVNQLFDTEEGQDIGLSYFKERGFKDTTIRKFRLGYNPSGWDQFTTEAMKQGYSGEALQQAGLARKSDKSGKLYDFYHDRVIFPIHNKSGKIVGFGGRVLQKDAKGMKYVNTPDNLIYHKRENLYGFYFAKNAIKKEDNVFLVEGYTDVLSMHEAGVENVVAASGTALPDEQIKLISLYTKNITLVNDGDKAGINASLKDIGNLLTKGLNVKVVLLPDGEDPDSFAKKCRDSELQAYLHDNATDFITFKIKVLSEDAGNDPMKRASLVSSVIQDIAALPDPIVQAFYIKKCAELFELSEEMLNVQLRKQVWKKLNKPATPEETQNVEAVNVVEPQSVSPQPKVDDDDTLQVAEEKLLALLVQFGMYEINVQSTSDENATQGTVMRIDQYVYDEFETEEITLLNPLNRAVYEEYAELAQTALSQEQIIRHFISHPDEAVRNMFVRLLMQDAPTYSERWKALDIVIRDVNNSQRRLQEEVANCVNRYKLYRLDQYIHMLQDELKEEHPDEVVSQIVVKYQKLIARRSEIAQMLGQVVLK